MDHWPQQLPAAARGSAQNARQLDRNLSGQSLTTATPCRLFLVTPPLADPAEVERLTAPLAAALEAGDVACLLLRLRRRDDDLLRHGSQSLAPLVQSKQVAFLIEDQVELALQVGAEGVHLSNGGDYGGARRRLGPDISIGMACRSRDEAMAAGDQDADYVAFGAFDDPAPTPATIALVEWWSDLMTVPCIAAGGAAPESCRPLIEAGTDFLVLPDAAWAGPNGGENIRAAMQLIAAAQPSRR
ncbi:MAG: thiamine phosphate synthase [Dongiaceae bacterium]